MQICDIVLICLFNKYFYLSFFSCHYHDHFVSVKLFLQLYRHCRDKKL